MRTGRIGLGHFLHKAKVLSYSTEKCSCNTGAETPRHVLMHCPLEVERRSTLQEALGGQLDYSQLVDTPKGAVVASKWMIQLKRLAQFQLAGQLLYEEDQH